MPGHALLELSARDIQDLASIDAVAQLFVRLGYDTEKRREMPPHLLGISKDNAARHIQRIELIASQSHQQTVELLVYLLVVSSITTEVINVLRTALQANRERFLLVLTTQNFQRLEFVWLESSVDLTASGPGALTGRPNKLRPRRFRVVRSGADPAATRRSLRFLRKLAYTGSDVFAQFERLTAAFTAGSSSEEHFDNRALFSDYYLRDRLPHDAEWSVSVGAHYRKLRELLLPTLISEAGLPGPEQSQALTRAVLEALGFAVGGGKDSKGNVFTLSAPGKDKQQLSICLHYPWGRFLDGKDSGDPLQPEQNPGAQVVLLQSDGGQPWAIVTNGLVWRLYSQQAHSRATNFYEINLAEILTADAEEVAEPSDAFKYFWLFFNSSAFELRTELADGQARERCFLDRMAERSADYAKKLGERLKERVFVEVFPHLAEGFIANIRQRSLQSEITEDVLKQCFQGTLTLLYRLLFLLYAEARDLLPVEESSGYFEASLKAIKEQAASSAGSIRDHVEAGLRKKYSLTDCELYERLTALCRVIDKGNADLNVPQYNGGLFITDPNPADTSVEAQTASFLRDTPVPDYYLALAIDLLARDIDDKRKDLAFIDYKSLGVRQLGSIYEGVLEFKLRIADEKLGVKKDKGKDVYVAFSEMSEREQAKAAAAPAWERRIIARGKVYLENDKRERKASGSYYTPDYIVKYIVEQAVGPVVDEKLGHMRDVLRKLEQKWQEHQKRNKARAANGDPRGTADSFYRDSGSGRFIEDLFDIKVLDPAMGSGHFLVEAVDFITDKLVAFLAGFPWNPVNSWHLPRMRDEILKGTKEQGVTIDPRRLTDVNLLKRHVLKRCIFGVDLNPMAVELAKVSLWLDCFTLGAPLSFLDHHLRCGNSLIGVTVAEVAKALRPKQMGMFESQFVGLQLATELMGKIGALSDITIGQAEESRREYNRATDQLKPFKRILDIYTSTWFGNTAQTIGRGASKRQIFPALDLLNHPAAESLLEAKTDAEAAQHVAALDPELRQIAEIGLRAAVEQRFFHWELEFPEVFYKDGQRAEQGGFDTVVGNPPYDVISEKENGLNVVPFQNFLSDQAQYSPAHHGKNNFYKLFLCRAHTLTNCRGSFGYIVPMTFLGDEQAHGVRRIWLKEGSIRRLEVFPQKDDADNRVFEEAKLATTIICASRIVTREAMKIRTHSGKQLDNILPVELTVEQLAQFDPEHLAIPTGKAEDLHLLLKILKNCPKRLGDYIEHRQGEFNETNDRAMLSGEPVGPQVLRGSCVTLYAIREPSQGESLFLIPEALSRRIRNAQEKGSGKVLDSGRERVVLQGHAAQNNFRRLIACKVPKDSYCLHSIVYLSPTTSVLNPDLALSLLNSRILEWMFRLTSSSAFISKYQVEGLPIPVIQVPTAQPDVRKLSLAGALETLLNGSSPGAISKECCEALMTVSRHIQSIEETRILGRRSERSLLSAESQDLQDAVDAYLAASFGLTKVDLEYIESRLVEML